jgi:hypothetical protein
MMAKPELALADTVKLLLYPELVGALSANVIVCAASVAEVDCVT